MASTSRFLRDYLRSSWRRCPAAFRHFSGTPFAEPDEIFAGLLQVADRLARGERTTPFRLYVRRRAVADPSASAARPADKSFSGYLGRLERKFGSDVGLIVNQFQAVQPALFARAADLLDDLYARVGIPAGGASLELFAGNYRTSPFGVHKDEQEVITFVLGGRKRFLLWPFEELRAALGAGARTRDVSFAPPEPFDYRPHRSRALVLEGEPGDIICWPREWWHVAESDGGRTTTVAIGLFLTGDPLRHAARAAHELWREGRGRLARRPRRPGAATVRHVGAHLAAAERALRSSQLRDALSSRLLAAHTAAGFYEIPDAGAADSAPSDATRLRAVHVNALAWVNNSETLTIGARGRVLRCPAHPRLLGLLRRLARGEALKVADILEQHAGRSETSSTVFLMDREELRGILGQLLGSGAVVKAGVLEV